MRKFYKIKIEKSERWPDKDTPVRSTTVWEKGGLFVQTLFARLETSCQILNIMLLFIHNAIYYQEKQIQL